MGCLRSADGNHGPEHQRLDCECFWSIVLVKRLPCQSRSCNALTLRHCAMVLLVFLLKDLNLEGEIVCRQDEAAKRMDDRMDHNIPLNDSNGSSSPFLYKESKTREVYEGRGHHNL